MDDKLKKKADKLLKNGGSTPLATLEATMEVSEKLDELTETIKAKPEVQKMQLETGEENELAVNFFKMLRGPKGEKGDSITGPQGEKGEDSTVEGPMGPVGPQGEPGRDGTNGVDGIDGIDGKDGVDGKDGLDGSPDTPEEIRDKLELLKDDDRLDVSAIKGIDFPSRDEISRQISLIPRGGGGSGGIEVFNSNGKVGSGAALKFVGSGVTASNTDGHTTVVTIAGGAETQTLADVSLLSDDATKSLYTMTSTIPVEFRRSAGATLLYFDETNGYMGINTTNPESQLTINTQATNVAAIRIKDAVGGSAADLFIAFNQDNQTTLGWGLGMNAVDNSFNLTYNTSGGSRIDSGQFITALTSGLIGIGQTTPTSKLDITTNSLGVTQTTTSGLALVNTTAASAGAQQISPAIRWSGFGWKTDATAESRSVDFRMDMLPVQAAANPSGLLQIGSSINGGAYTTFYSFTSAGVFGVSNGTSNQITMTGSTARINGGASLANYFYFTPGGYDAGYFTGNTNAGVTAYGFTIGGNSDVYTSGTAGVLRVNRNFGAGAGSGVWRPMSVEYTINNSGVQSGTATGIFLNATETALNSMGHNVMDLQVGGASKLLVTNTGAITINAEYTLPTTDGGANQVLTTDGAGVVTWEDGGGGVPTAITVADEASDTTCFPSFFTAATGDLGPKTNAGLTYNSATGAFAVAPTVSGSLSGTYSILRSAPTYTNSGASNATINGLSIATTVNNSSTGQSNVYGVNMTVAQSDTITTSSNMRGLEFAVTGYKAATMYAILGSANVYNPSGTNASNVIGQYLLVSQSDNPTTFNHGNVTNMYGSYISTVTSIGTVTSQAGFYAASVVNSGGTVTDLHGLRLQTIGISGGSATNVYGIKLDTIYNSSGTITNTYGIYTGDVTNGTQTNKAYNIYLSDTNARNYLAGATGINAQPTTTSTLNIGGLPTSAAGLAAGDVWIDTTAGANILKIV